MSAGESIMNQKEINRSEWEDPANWSGPAWFRTYASSADRRWIVPKRRLWAGWTLNMAHPAGAFILTGIIVGVVIGCCYVCKGFLGV